MAKPIKVLAGAGALTTRVPGGGSTIQSFSGRKPPLLPGTAGKETRDRFPTHITTSMNPLKPIKPLKAPGGE